MTAATIICTCGHPDYLHNGKGCTYGEGQDDWDNCTRKNWCRCRQSYSKVRRAKHPTGVDSPAQIEPTLPTSQ